MKKVAKKTRVQKKAKVTKTEEDKKQEQIERGISVVVGDGSGSDTAFVPVRWCLNASLRQFLLEKMREMPGRMFYILILAVERETERDVRKVVRWDVGEDYISFSRPGTWDVYVSMLYPEREKDIEDFTRAMKKLGRDRYQESSHGYIDIADLLPGNSIHIRLGGRYQDYSYVHAESAASTKVEVLVPKEFFANEPHKVLKWLSQLGYENRPFDQCHFRRRLIFSPIFLFFFLMNVMFEFLVAEILLIFSISFGLLFGRYGMGYRWILHPLQAFEEAYNTKDLVQKFAYGGRDIDYNFFDCDKAGKPRPWYWSYFKPTRWIIVGGISFLAWKIGIGNMALLGLFWVASLLLIYPILALVGKFMGIFNTSFEGLLKEKQEQLGQKRLITVEEKLALLACPATGVSPSQDLPPQLQTFRLTLLSIKAKVCRPFAR